MKSFREWLIGLVSGNIVFRGREYSFSAQYAVIVFLLCALLLLSLNPGWLWLAGLIVLSSGTVSGILFLYAGDLAASIGHTRTAVLSAVSLALCMASMTVLAACDLLLASGLQGVPVIVFFLVACSAIPGFLAVRVPQTARPLGVVITLAVLFSLFPGNGVVSGEGSVVRKLAEAVLPGSAVPVAHSDKAIRQKYFDEYRLLVEALEEEWRQKKLTASEYEKRRRAVDAAYAAYPGRDFAGVSDSAGFLVRGSFVSRNLGDRGDAFSRGRILAGEQMLFFYMNYSGGDPSEQAYVLRWLKDNVIISTRSVRFATEAGELVDSLRYAFVQGSYEIQLLCGDRLLGNTRFSVIEPAVLKLRALRAVPRNVFPGDMLNVDVEYYFSASGPGFLVPVREQCFIRKNGREVMAPVVHDVQREEGFSTASFRIPVPEHAFSGTYEVEAVIACDGSVARRSALFSVSSPNPFRFDEEESDAYRGGGDSRSGKNGKREVNLDQLGRMLKRIYGD